MLDSEIIGAKSLALQFVEYLAQGDVTAARQLLSEKEAACWPEDILLKAWCHSLADETSLLGDISILHDEVEHDDMALWPSKEPGDKAWVYIPMLTLWSYSALSVIGVSTRYGLLLRNLRFEEPR